MTKKFYTLGAGGRALREGPAGPGGGHLEEGPDGGLLRVHSQVEAGEDVSLLWIFASRGLPASGWTYAPLRRLLRALGVTRPRKWGRASS